MPEASELREYAVQCMEHARRAKDDAARLAWIEMASYWLRFAEETEAGKRNPE